MAENPFIFLYSLMTNTRLFKVKILGVEHNVGLLPKDFYFTDWQMFDKVTAGNQTVKDQMIIGVVKRKLNGNVVKISKSEVNKQKKTFKDIDSRFQTLTDCTLKDHVADFFQLFDLVFLIHTKRPNANPKTLEKREEELESKIYNLRRDINVDEDKFEMMLIFVSLSASKLGYIVKKWQDNHTYLDYLNYDSNI